MVLSNTNDDKIYQPHDKRFKILLSNPKRFFDFLKDCVNMPWVEYLDKNTLKKS